MARLLACAITGLCLVKDTKKPARGAAGHKE
jgi:hypothetical protein